MRESKLYLKYFKDHLIVLLVLTLIGGVVGWYYQTKQPIKYQLIQLIEMDYSDKNIQDRVTLTDELVSTVRSAGLKKQLGVNSGTKVSLVKTGPLSVTITLESLDNRVTARDLPKLTDYISHQFPIHLVGESTLSQKKSAQVIAITLGIAVGFLIGNILILLRSYFKYY